MALIRPPMPPPSPAGFFDEFGGMPDTTVTPPAPGTPTNTGINGAPGTVQPTPGAPAGVTMDVFNQAWLNSPYPGTVDGLKQFMAAHPEYAAAGITLGGSKGDKVYGPGGSYWGDAVISAGLGGRGKSGLSGDTGSQGGTLGSLGYGYGSAMAPWMENWKSPTAEEAMNAPGVQFGLEEANRMMQNGAAARGTLLNGRVQQAISASNVGNAMQRYGDVRNWALGDYQQRQGDEYARQDRPFQKFTTLAQLGKPS